MGWPGIDEGSAQRKAALGKKDLFTLRQQRWRCLMHMMTRAATKPGLLSAAPSCSLV